jgi:hypothetical protein
MSEKYPTIEVWEKLTTSELVVYLDKESKDLVNFILNKIQKNIENE